MEQPEKKFDLGLPVRKKESKFQSATYVIKGILLVLGIPLGFLWLLQLSGHCVVFWVSTTRECPAGGVIGNFVYLIGTFLVFGVIMAVLGILAGVVSMIFGRGRKKIGL